MSGPRQEPFSKMCTNYYTTHAVFSPSCCPPPLARVSTFFMLYVTLQSLLYNSSLSLSCFFVYPRILTIHARGILLHKTNPYIRNLKNGKERPHGRRIYWRLSVVRIEYAPTLKRADVHMEKLMIQVIRYRIAGVDGRKKRELVGRLEKTK